MGGAVLLGLCASCCVGAIGAEASSDRPVAAPTAARLEDFRNERRLVEFKDLFIIDLLGRVAESVRIAAAAIEDRG